MASDIAAKFLLVTLAVTVALALVLLLRLPSRKWFGPGLAYALWGLLPTVLLAALLPARFAPATVMSIPAAAAGLPVVGPAFAQAPDQTWPLVLLAIWLAGAVLLALYFLRQHRAFLAVLGPLTNRHGIHYAESTVCGPALIGIWQARIVVPADFDLRYEMEERKLIVAHERTHLQRADAGANLLCALLQCVFWFHPLFHIASRAFRFDQELACDAAVMLQHPESRQAYATAMMKTQLVASGTPAGCYWQFNHPLKERVMNLKRNSPNLLTRIMGGLLIATVAGGGAYGAWAAQAPQAGTKTYRLALDLQDKYGGITPVLLVHEGEEAAVEHGDGDKPMRYALTVKPAQAGAVKVSLLASYGKTVISKPRLVVGLGQPGTIETSSDPAEDGNYTLKLTVTDAAAGQ